MKRKTKGEIRNLREDINKLVQQGFSYQEIANMLKIDSKQMVCYHFHKYRNTKKVAGNKPIK